MAEEGGKLDLQLCAHCEQDIYHGTYAQRERGPTVAEIHLVAGTPSWRHFRTGLPSCLSMSAPNSLAQPVEPGG